MSVRITRDIREANAVTHSGPFHADEVFATVVLCRIMPELVLCRIGSIPENLPEKIIVFDIGSGKFDHHQKVGNGCRENGVPYATAGLIWKHFGMQTLQNSCAPEKLWKQMDRILFQGIDAVDNGSVPKNDYPASVLHVSQLIGMMNPVWDSTKSIDEAFLEAVSAAERIFDRICENLESKIKAFDYVERAVEQTDGSILVLEQYVPWQEALLTMETDKANQIHFVVYPSLRGGYSWQGVPKEAGSHSLRKKVPESWRGLYGEALQQIAEIPTAIFCHQGGFVGGAETLEDTIRMAIKADMDESDTEKTDNPHICESKFDKTTVK